MTAPATLEIPRAGYGLTMAVVTALGLLCAASVAAGLGGDGRAVASAVGALAIGSLATVVPAALSIGRDYWGVAVLFCGTVRGLAVLAIAYILNQTGIPSRPLFIGAVSGAVLILIVESAVAIRILARIERRRAELKNTPT